MMATNTKAVSKSKKVEMQERSLQILLKEYDALRDMYNQAMNSGQTMFNYYLTLMTAVFGGVALVSQPSSGVFMPRTFSSVLLIIFAVIGSFYLSSLSTNFAHAMRYARGVNELRRFIFERYDVSVPPIYAKFMAEKSEEKQSRIVFLISLLIPVNTHQLFTATVNSLSWAFVISIVYFSINNYMTALELVSRGVLAFVVTYLIYSIYARLVYHLTISRSNVSIGH